MANNTIILYDNNGGVYGMFNDTPEKIATIRPLAYETPEGKMLDYLDMETDPPTPVFSDKPDYDELEAQIFYTAVMTDTLLEREEE